MQVLGHSCCHDPDQEVFRLLRIEWLPVPLDAEGLALASDARELHRIEIDEAAREFPTDGALTRQWWSAWLGLMFALDWQRVIGYLSMKCVEDENR